MKSFSHFVLTAGLLFIAALLSPPFIHAQTGIGGIQPHAGPGGTVVTVSGKSLANTTAATINGIPATVANVTDNAVKLIAPSTPGTGIVVLTVGGAFVNSPDNFTVSPILMQFIPGVDSGVTKQIVIGDVDGDGSNDVMEMVYLHKEGIIHRDLACRLASGSGGIHRPPVLTNLDVVESDSTPVSLTFTVTNSGGVASGVLACLQGGGGAGGMNLVLLVPNPTLPGAFKTSYSYAWSLSQRPAGSSARVATGDLNGDGLPDVVCAIQGIGEDSLYIFLSNAGTPGGYSPPIAIDEPGVQITDFALSGTSSSATSIDIFVSTPNGVDQYVNSGDGVHYTPQASVVSITGTTRVALADLNGDGLTDIATLNATSGEVTRFDASVAGWAISEQYQSGAATANDLKIIDADGDGYNDIAIDEPGVQRAISFLRGDVNGSGSVASMSRFTTSGDCDDNDPRAFAIGDLNGDGYPDLAVASCPSNFTVLPHITSFTPMTGKNGTIVTVSGGYLDQATSVQAGSTACDIISQSDSLLLFHIVNNPSSDTVTDIRVISASDVATDINPLTITPGVDSSTAITGFTPQAGPVGTIITISGAGLEYATGVTIGGVSSPIVDKSNTSLKAIVPSSASTGSISVTTPKGSVKPVNSFTVTKNVMQYLPNVDSAITRQILVGDVDGDGFNDVVQAVIIKNMRDRINELELVCHLSSGSGGPRLPVITNLGALESDTTPVSLAFTVTNTGGVTSGTLACLNGGGGAGGMKLVLLHPDHSTPGEFTVSYSYAWSLSQRPAGSNARVASGDLNGDGIPDVVCAVQGIGEDSLYVFLSNAGSPGGYAPPIAIDEPGVHITDFALSPPSSAVPAPPTDIFVSTSAGVDLLENTGDGMHFTQHPGIATVDNTTCLMVADVTGDNMPDVVTLDSKSGTVTIFTSSSRGIMARTGAYVAGSTTLNAMAAVDVDGDGVQDIAIDEPGVQKSITFLKAWGSGGGGGGGGGTLSQLEPIPTAADCDDTDYRCFAVGDVTGDGIPDVVVGACLERITILPKITSFTPTMGMVGTVVTVFGQDLSGVTSVSIGGVACPILAQTNDQLVCNSKNSGHASESLRLTTPAGVATDLQLFSSTPNGFVTVPHIDSTVSGQILIGDVDGDGISDMVQIHVSRDYHRPPFLNFVAQFRFGIGIGKPEPPYVVTECAMSDTGSPLQVAIGDLNGDGHADLAMTGKLAPLHDGLEQSMSASSMVRIMFSDTSNPGAFGSSVQFVMDDPNSTVSSPVIGDLDGDGYPDVAFIVSSSAGDSIFVWYNDAARPGNLKASKPVSLCGTTNHFRCLAFEPDKPGIASFIAAGTDSGILALRKLPGRSSYASITLEAGATKWIGIGDNDGDGYPDIAAVESATGNVLVCWGTGDSFSPPVAVERVTSTHFETGDIPTEEQFYNDGKSSIILHEPGSPYACTVLRASNDRVFSTAYIHEDCDDGNDYKAVAVGDVNGDGIPDLVMGSCTSSSLSPPIVTVLEPVTGPRGMEISCTGTHLKSVSGVTYVGNTLDILHQDDTSITAKAINTKLNLSGGTLTGNLRFAGGPGSVAYGPEPFSLTPNIITHLPRVDSSRERQLFLADVDGDGHLDAVEGIVHRDLAARNLLLSVSRGNGDGSFSPPSVFSTNGLVQIDDSASHGEGVVAVGDVDGDGRADVVVLGDSGIVSILSPDTTHTGQWLEKGKKGLNAVNVKLASRVAVGDVNGDGKPDIVIASGDSLYVFNQGNPLSFSLTSSTALGDGSGHINRVRLSYSRKLDPSSLGATVCVMIDSSIEIYESKGGSSALTRAFTVDAQGPDVDFAIADVDGDGAPDVVCLDRSSGTVSTFLRKEGENPLYKQSDQKYTEWGAGPRHYDDVKVRLFTGDLDGDGMPDLIDVPDSGGTVSALLNVSGKSKNNTNWSFQGGGALKIHFSATDNDALTLASATLNSDAFSDFVVSSSSDSLLSSPLFVANPSAMDFGTVSVGDSLTKTLTLTNYGGIALTISSASISPPDNGFSIASGPLLTSLDAGSSTTVDVKLHVTRPAADPTSTLSITSSGGDLTIKLSATVNDTARFRSFSLDSIYTMLTSKKKFVKSITLAKPTYASFACKFIAPADSLDGLVVVATTPIDTTSPYLLSGSSLSTITGKLKQLNFTLPPASPGGTEYTLSARTWSNKAAKIASYYWTKKGKIAGKKQSNPLFMENKLGYPLPNRMNVIEQVFKDSGFTATHGLLVGRARSDSAKYYGWLQCAKATDFSTTLADGKAIQLYLSKKGYDYYQSQSSKRLVGGQKSLPPTKYQNVLMANLAVLKLNIAASQIGLTPRGFGDLLFAGTQAESSAFFGWSVSSIAALGDSMMSGSYVNGKITFLDTTVFSSLNDAVVRINASGECVLDTLPGGYSTTHLRLTGKGIIEQQVLVRNPSAITPGTVSSIVQPALPTQYALRQNYPNPFNPTTTISFALSKSSIVTITIYNVLGQVVKNLIDHQLMDGGDYAQQFNANNFSSGVYFYRITAQPVDANGRSQASSFTEVKKMVLMK